MPSLPTEFFELYKQKTGKDVDQVPQEEVRRTEEGFVGKKLTYLASEVVNPPLPDKRRNGGTKPESTLLLSQLLDNKEEAEQAGRGDGDKPSN